MIAAQTLFDKIWQRHVVVDRGDGYQLLYIDRHLMHDGSAAGFARLRQRGQTQRAQGSCGGRSAGSAQEGTAADGCWCCHGVVSC